MTNDEFILLHREDDVRTLALRNPPQGVDLRWCLGQIEGWQKAVQKLPRWAGVDGLWFPPSLSLQQCSSQQTAAYKSELVRRQLPLSEERDRFVDLTGGYGIDFCDLAPLFSSAHYVERSEELCSIARHNFPLLGLVNTQVHCQEASAFLQDTANVRYSLAYLDPARRDEAGRKTVAISDCTPDLSLLQHRLLQQTHIVLCKLSPMLDITAALSQLHHVREIHSVALRGECKELLLVMDGSFQEHPSLFAVNLESLDPVVSFRMEEIAAAKVSLALPSSGGYLYEPNAAVLKAGMQDVVAASLGLRKLHPMSNLFLSPLPVERFPGRSFRIDSCCGFGKRELRKTLGSLQCANITVRNFPASVAELRRRLRLADGGDVYLFATTLQDDSHALIRCSKTA